jgi:hypothetical protein
MRFLYVLTGWERSAMDTHVYEDAWGHDFTIPDGKYYLAAVTIQSVPFLSQAFSPSGYLFFHHHLLLDLSPSGYL